MDVAVGFGLMSSPPSTEAVPKEQYDFQAILGMRFGLGFSSLIIVTRVEADDGDSDTSCKGSYTYSEKALIILHFLD